MHERRTAVPIDGRIAAAADRQFGVISRAQLFALGLGRGAIDHRILANRLHPLYLGVNAVGHRVTPWRGMCMAAALACGPG